MFELMRKLGVDLWCFHDRDIAPRGDTLEETNANLDEIVEYAAQLQEGTEQGRCGAPRGSSQSRITCTEPRRSPSVSSL